MPDTNPYADAASAAKVTKLLSMARHHEITADQMADMGSRQWAMLEKAAGVKQCSQETRELAVATYRNVEAARTRTVDTFPDFAGGE